MNRMLAILTALALAAGPGSYAEQVKAAKQDYNAQASIGYTGARYLYVGSVAPEKRAALLTALRFWIPHISRAKPLEHQLPVQLSYKNDAGETVDTDMYRIDIDSALWGRKAWLTLAKEYPYSDFVDPLIIRGDWLVNVTSDTVESQAYYTLLYAETGTPKNKAELLKVWNIIVDDDDRTAAIIDEGKGGVSFKTRVIVEGPAPGGRWWESYDSRDGFGGFDALEQLDLAKLKFDAQEFIIPFEKISLSKGERGIVLAYFLTNAAGLRQEAAPVDIVEDHARFLGIAEIRTGGHCASCHTAFNGAAENAFREWVKLGIERREKDKKTQEALEAFLLAKQDKVVSRGNEDFEAFCQLACGVSAKEAQAAYIEAAEGYDAPVTLEQAAREVYSTPDELRSAIAYYSEAAGPLENYGRLVSLAHGRTVGRKQFEGEVVKGQPGVYHQAIAAIQLWKGKQ